MTLGAGCAGWGCLLLALPLLLMGQRSPEVLPDGRVTFRLRAPDAKEVLAKGQFGADVILEKDGGGQWRGTTKDRVTPGIHEYRFEVDSLRILDPRNSAVKPQRWPGTSILHVPAVPPAHWDRREVPHGTIEQVGYVSKSLGKVWREMVVYLPPNAEKPLPVLYLAHGFSDEEKTWTVHGKAHWILDALIAEKRAVPMMVVMPDAHALDPEGSEWQQYGAANSEAFCQELVSEIVPLIETRYPVLAGADHRAFAGLSMGGMHALTLALNHSDRFASIGAFSAATPSNDVITAGLKRVNRLNQQLDLLWIACGDKDFLFGRNESLHARFEVAGMKHDYVVTQGDNHSWPVWRRYLSTFLPKLFH